MDMPASGLTPGVGETMSVVWLEEEEGKEEEEEEGEGGREGGSGTHS